MTQAWNDSLSWPGTAVQNAECFGQLPLPTGEGGPRQRAG